MAALLLATVATCGALLCLRSAESAQGFVAGALAGEGRGESVVARRGSRVKPKNGKVFPWESKPVRESIQAMTQEGIHQMMAEARKEKFAIRMEKFRRATYDMKRHPIAVYKIKAGKIELHKRDMKMWEEEETTRVAARKAQGLPIFEDPPTAVEADELYGRWTKDDQIRAWRAQATVGQGYFWQTSVGFYTRVKKAKSKWGPRTYGKVKFPWYVQHFPKYTDHEHTFHYAEAKKFADDNGLQMPFEAAQRGGVPYENMIKFKTFLEEDRKEKPRSKVDIWLKTGVRPGDQKEEAPTEEMLKEEA